MKVGDKINEVLKILEQDSEKWMHLTITGSILNVLEEGIEELRDNEIFEEFLKLKELVINKREEILNKEIKDTPEPKGEKP